jgi:hypothetical protein
MTIELTGCVADVRPSWMWQLYDECARLLTNGLRQHMFLEIIALCRELSRVGPEDLWFDCCMRSADAMVALQKLDEAEAMLHGTLAVCPQEGPWITSVSQTLICWYTVSAPQSKVAS